MKPVICMITDRHRAGGEDALVQRVAAAARHGVDLVQVRERELDGGPLMRLVQRCVDVVRSTRTRVLVNDRLDVALAAGAHGVHLRGDSMPARRARMLVPAGFLVGRSVHTREDVACVSTEGGVDYVVFGPIFPTASKPGHPGTGVNALREIVTDTSVPVLAIGGIRRDSIDQIMRAGAAGVAAISLFDTPLTVP